MADRLGPAIRARRRPALSSARRVCYRTFGNLIVANRIPDVALGPSSLRVRFPRRAHGGGCARLDLDLPGAAIGPRPLEHARDKPQSLARRTSGSPLLDVENRATNFEQPSCVDRPDINRVAPGWP